MGTINANRWIRIRQEALVGEAHQQRRLAHRCIACQTTVLPVSPPETTKVRRMKRLASDDELENVMPCYTSHGIPVVRSDGNYREPNAGVFLAPFAAQRHRPHTPRAESSVPSLPGGRLSRNDFLCHVLRRSSSHPEFGVFWAGNKFEHPSDISHSSPRTHCDHATMGHA